MFFFVIIGNRVGLFAFVPVFLSVNYGFLYVFHIASRADILFPALKCFSNLITAAVHFTMFLSGTKLDRN